MGTIQITKAKDSKEKKDKKIKTITILLLIFFVMISFYAINFSVRLFRVLFLKENINLTQCFKRYNQIGIICVIGILLCSIFETFVMPILMNLFL